MDYGKGALVFTTWAIHLHSVTLAFSQSGYSSYSWDNDDKNNGKGNNKGGNDNSDLVTGP